VADPILSELIVMASLDIPVSLQNIESLQSAALISVVDAFDRRIERESFCEIVAASLALHSYLARLNLAAAVESLLAKDVLTLKKVQDAAQSLTMDGEAARIALKRFMHLVVQCPTSADPIH
jgi:hypothetical protein